MAIYVCAHVRFGNNDSPPHYFKSVHEVNFCGIVPPRALYSIGLR